jgi:hypothetical protein
MGARAFWTVDHIAGLVLLLSAISALGAYQYMYVRDKHGPVIFGQPTREWLRLVHDHPRPWRAGTISFISAILGTTIGLDLLAIVLRHGGDPGFAEVGLLTFAIGAVFWVIILAARISVDPWAGKELAANSAVPELYEPVTRWNGTMFVIFTILAFAGVMMFGEAILSTSLLPHWLGWATIVYSVLGLLLLAVTRDVLPIMHHLMPLVIGIALLLT